MTDRSGRDGEAIYHLPALPEEVVGLLALRPGAVAVDVTLGGGGHAELMLKSSGPDGILIGTDRDADAIEEAADRLAWAGERAILERARMSDIAGVLSKLDVDGVDAILADLGVSSYQLDEASRGFSIRNDGPLDMRMDGDGGETAADLIARSSAEELEGVFRDFGEERYARRIARAVAGRSDIATTGELAEAVERAVPRTGRGRIHPATRIFQALRIAVNDELGQLRDFLDTAPELLRPGGRMAVISYHSLEDRMVKRAFRSLASEGGYEILTKRPVRPKEDEVGKNPRARSAKLRGLRRCA